MDFQGLYTRTAEILEDSTNAQWALALVKQYCNDGAQDFAKRTKVYKKRSAALTESATTPDNAWYTLPTDLWEIEQVKSDGTILPLIPQEMLPDDWEDETGGTIPTFAIYGDEGLAEIRMYPTPSAALSALRVYYTALPPTMSANGDVPTGIPDSYRIALVYYAVAQCYRRNFEDGDRPKADLYWNLYLEQVQDCMARAARRHTSQAVSVPYRVV